MSNPETSRSAHVDTLDGERGIPGINERGGSTAHRGLIVLILLLMLCVTCGLGYWKYRKNAARNAEASAPRDMELNSAVPSRTFTDPRPAVSPDKPLPMAGPASASAPSPALPVAAHDGPPAPVLDKSASALMAGGGRGADNAAAGGAPPAPDAASGPMAAMLASTRSPARAASMLGDRNFLLAIGSFIDCALQTRLDSTVPGMTACVVTRNIYSDNGKVLLIERGSTVSGEYQSNLRQGMARIFVLWSRIKTPQGVVIPLDSPGTDPLGGAGLPGEVDNHFWQRFGGALMLSMVDDAARLLTSPADSNSGQQNVNFNSTGEAVQNMATEALKNTINIPPTLYKNQGDQVGIYVARDLNFSSVYDVSTD